MSNFPVLIPVFFGQNRYSVLEISGIGTGINTGIDTGNTEYRFCKKGSGSAFPSCYLSIYEPKERVTENVL